MEQSVANAFQPRFIQNISVCNRPIENNDVSTFSELFTGDSLLELCNSFWMRSPSTSKDIQPYLRGCKWSPDGTCCLSVVNHDGFHIMELPLDLYEGCPKNDRTVALLPAVVHVKESGLVYDFCWYPKMNSHYPETCSWLSTKINAPIQMWDGYDGALRCSYRGFNAVDEMEPAISVTFINQGDRIVGGYKNCLRTFDVERPGREYLEHKIKSPASCFATHGNMLAVGSWNANINLFSILDNGTYRSVGNLHAHTGGITHLKFTPDGTKLVSGARKDHRLCVWDIRYFRRPLNILKRSVDTNQRIYFDISTCGRYLVSGGTDGVIRVWDNKFAKWTQQYDVKDPNEDNATFQFQLYRDCCNSVSIHPSRPILATGSGQFHFLDPVKTLELEPINGKNSEDCAIVKPHSISIGSTDEETSVDSAELVVTEENKSNSVVTEVRTQDISKDASSKIDLIDSTTELNDAISNNAKAADKIADEDIKAVCSTKIIPSETSSEPPPRKKRKLSNEIYDTIAAEETNDIEDSESIPILSTCNNTLDIVDINEESSGRKDGLAIIQPSTETTNIGEIVDSPGCELKNSFLNKTSSEEIEDSMLSSIKNYEQIPREMRHSSNSCIISHSDSVGVQSIVNVNKLDETNVVPIEEPSLTKTDESTSNTDLENINKSSTFHNPVLVEKPDTDNQLQAKLAKLSQTYKPLTKTPKVDLEKSPNNECTVDDALESDEDCSDINEKKMKYSSHAENNLTFWWIAKIFDR